MLYDYAIIGAGYGGLAAGALLTRAGFSVLVLESHSLPGGCASHYKKDGFSFDVGATTITGFSEGKPLDILARILGKKKQFGRHLYRCPIGMTIYQEGEIINRFADINLWLREVKAKFTKIDPYNLEKFFRFVDHSEKTAWNILRDNQRLLPSSMDDILDLFQPKKLERNIKGVPLIPGIFDTFHNLIQRFKLNGDGNFVRLLNEILMITSQSEYYDCPWISGVMGMAYPSEVYYPIGSISRMAEDLVDYIVENGGEVGFKQEVVALGYLHGRYTVSTDPVKAQRSNIMQSEFDANGIISNIPIWNTVDISERTISKHLKPYAQKFSSAHGAFTMYFGLKFTDKVNDKFKEIYHQIHFSEEIPFVTSGSAFMTVSRYDDKERAPQGWRSVTISTHVDTDDWLNLDDEKYDERKTLVQERILQEVFAALPSFKEAKIDFLQAGTPKSFEFFTKRKNGFVGGIPHKVAPTMYEMTPNKVPNHNFYLVGDTTFPGQGIASVVYSALSVYNKIIEADKKKK